MDDTQRFVLRRIRDRAVGGYDGLGLGDAADDVDVLLEIIDELVSERATLLSDAGRWHGAALADADRWKRLAARVMYVLVHDWPDGLGWPVAFRELHAALHADRLPPGICRVCGCTDANACDPPCSWANDDRTLCSSCVVEADLVEDGDQLDPVMFDAGDVEQVRDLDDGDPTPMPVRMLVLGEHHAVFVGSKVAVGALSTCVAAGQQAIREGGGHG